MVYRENKTANNGFRRATVRPPALWPYLFAHCDPNISGPA
jgi:hypothetical protein